MNTCNFSFILKSKTGRVKPFYAHNNRFDRFYRELSRTFARLCHLVDESSKEMTIEMEQLDHEIRSLEEAASQAKKLRNSANYVTKELEMFDDAYLRNID